MYVGSLPSATAFGCAATVAGAVVGAPRRPRVRSWGQRRRAGALVGAAAVVGAGALVGFAAAGAGVGAGAAAGLHAANNWTQPASPGHRSGATRADDSTCGVPFLDADQFTAVWVCQYVK